MLRKLTVVASRDNDSLALRRGEALALVLLLLLFLNGLYIAVRVLINSTVGIVSFISIGLLAVAYATNRRGRVGVAIALLQAGGVLLIVGGSIVARAPYSTLAFLNLIIVIAAAFGRPQAPLLWAAALTGVPFVVNLILYGSLLAPNQPIVLPNQAVMPSILALQIMTIGLLWMIAGTAYLSSRLLNQLLAESRAAAAQALAANQALRQSEERFSKIFHLSPVAISIAAMPEGRIIEVNDTFLHLLGYQREEIVGRIALDLDMWTNREQRDRIVALLRERGLLQNVEVDFQTRVGERGKSLASIAMLEIAGQMCALSMFYDITQLKRADAALRESEERYRLISEQSSDLIALFDQQDRFVYASPSHRQLLGRDPADLLGTREHDLVHPDDIRYLEEAHDQLTDTGAIRATFRYRHADGSWRWLESSMTNTIHQGKPHHVSVARDVTERRRLEEQFQQAQKMESIGRLAGGVAHDFNNLLTVITGYAQMARDFLPPDDPVAGDLGELLKAADRATSLTRQLLAFARRQRIEPRVLNLNDLILEMDRLLRRLIGEDVDLVTHPAAGLGWARVDPGQIEQVLINLAVNARDAMPQGGKLTVETQNVEIDEAYVGQHLGISSGAYIMLAIGDTGTGIDPEIKAHLFEPFYTTKTAGKGTGLGLATCYGIVKQHGGAIEVYSEAGHGTTFKIYLPRVAEGPQAAANDEPAEALPRGDETVLVVEDDPALRELAARVLRAQGYAVLEAANGEEAIALAEGGARIRLLLTDMILPQIGGTALAGLLMERSPSLKVLFMSGYTDDAIIHHGRLSAGAAFLQKPFSPAALAHKVRDTLDGA